MIKKAGVHHTSFFYASLGYFKINTHLCIGNKVLDSRNFLIQIVMRL